jgi:hypothetical protein
VSSRVRGTRLRADFGFWILDGEILTRVNLVTARRVHMWGAREVIRAEAWRDPASLLTARIRMELGPLRPAPAHSGLSFHDGMDVRLRG